MKNRIKFILLFIILFFISLFSISYPQSSSSALIKKIDGNSFSFTFAQEVVFPKETRTASIILDNSNNYEIFTQEGKKFQKSSSSQIILPSNFF